MEESGSFRGLLFEPTLEHEVVILFSLLIPHLKRDTFVIDRYPDTFPDCSAIRNGQRIGIEFEVLASNFRRHEVHDDLSKCNLLICWHNNVSSRITTRNGVKFLKVKEHEIEVMALDDILHDLEEKKSLRLILKDEPRPDKGEANEERFFAQLKENVGERYRLVKELFDYVGRREEFKIGWGKGKRWFTMRIFMKTSGHDPIYVWGNGAVSVGYQGNPRDTSPWEMPQETQAKLRQIFRHRATAKWPSIHLNTQADLDNIKSAVDVLAEHSGRSDEKWER